MPANRRAQSRGVCVGTDPLTIGYDYRKRVRDVSKSARCVNCLLPLSQPGFFVLQKPRDEAHFAP